MQMIQGNMPKQLEWWGEAPFYTLEAARQRRRTPHLRRHPK
jgi:hypothetical protein